MFTKSTMHDWIPSTTSVGTPSYVYTAVYQPFTDRIFTSLACHSLGCGTTLQFPRTHIIFSLASFAPSITRQDIRQLMATLTPSSRYARTHTTCWRHSAPISQSWPQPSTI
ncbi:hypothetical protein DFH06DRAFT_1164143 [Mycena polygramma]|nr:hypothetical protein DFH06DRAFT_1164143 [Mycena polygramma]